MRQKKKGRLLNIQLLFIVVALCEIVGTLILSSALTWFLSFLLNRVVELPPIAWLLIFSVTIGIAVSVIVSIILLRPVMKLSRAMDQVARGDFTVRLDTHSRIREIRESCENFNLMVTELQATEILQTDFVSNVSHEFKTPINAIEGYAMLLQGTDSAAQQKDYTDRILMNTRRLSRLVGNILLLSKASAQAIPAQETTYRLDEQIRQALLLLEPQWTERETEFDVDLEECLWSGPESLLHHVWSNLIGNAVKFGPQGGLVKIALKHTDRRFVFAIDDQGPGIPESEMEHIFNRFYQLDSSHTQEGNGLGLALCRQIVALVGGELKVENLPQGGCRFTVTLKS